jgi:cation diffusion facilitator family transporter
LNREERYKSNLRIQKLAIYVGITLLIIKFTAYFLTNSNAILTDAFESIVNVFASFIGLFSLTISSTPKDKNHPYGHGKIEFISGLAEGLMLLIAAFLIIATAIYGFFVPNVLEKLDLGLGLIIISGIVNYIIGEMAERQGKKTDSMTLIAGGKHLKADAYTTLGLVIGLILIMVSGLVWIDNVVALAFGVLILFSSWKILRKSVAGIMDEADFESLEKLAHGLESNRIPEWVDIHNLRLVKYGPDPHIDCHLTIPYYRDLKFANKQILKLNEIVNETMGIDSEMFVHVDPCVSNQCSICEVQDCNFRKNAFNKKIKWSLENILQDKHHGLDE